MCLYNWGRRKLITKKNIVFAGKCRYHIEYSTNNILWRRIAIWNMQSQSKNFN